MTAINSSRLAEMVSKSVGPAPWQWKTFPAIQSASGERFEWTHHGERGAIAHLVTLNIEHDPDHPRLALNTYCRPFLVPPSFLGVWCPNGRNIRMLCFNPADLTPFDLAEVAGWFKQSSERIYAATPPMDEFEVSTQLQAGMNEIKVPADFQTLDELIIPSSRPTRTNDDAAFALYVIYPHAGLVEVLPQKWFTAAQYDVGRQWITRAVRDPDSHRIIGECLRAGKFLLKEDGCSIDRWLEKVEL